MKYTLLLPFFFFLFVRVSAQQPATRGEIRIVDTLTKAERNSRNPVLLKAEVDSIIQQYMAGLPPVQAQPPIKETITEIPSWVTITGIAALFIIAIMLYLLFYYHKRLTKTVADLKRLVQNFDYYVTSTSGTNAETAGKGKTSQEKKVNELKTQLEKEKAAKAELLQEYGIVKQTIAEVYKVRNYPLFAKEKEEHQIITDLLKTERSIASHAFEKFLKPIIAITDANKNNPSRISEEDSQKLVELLVSLSFYHIEYLYLRINELAVGGNMVQRIGSNGNGINPALLKKLNTDHGSRALAMRMALDKCGISQLSYPVFDETDLNNF